MIVTGIVAVRLPSETADCHGIGGFVCSVKCRFGFQLSSGVLSISNAAASGATERIGERVIIGIGGIADTALPMFCPAAVFSATRTRRRVRPLCKCGCVIGCRWGCCLGVGAVAPSSFISQSPLLSFSATKRIRDVINLCISDIEAIATAKEQELPISSAVDRELGICARIGAALACGKRIPDATKAVRCRWWFYRRWFYRRWFYRRWFYRRWDYTCTSDGDVTGMRVCPCHRRQRW